MTRDEFKNHLSKVYNKVVIVTETDHAPVKGENLDEKAAREIELKQTMALIDTGFTIAAGFGDAILEIRDNSRSEEKPNPFGADYQERVGKP